MEAENLSVEDPDKAALEEMSETDIAQGKQPRTWSLATLVVADPFIVSKVCCYSSRSLSLGDPFFVVDRTQRVQSQFTRLSASRQSADAPYGSSPKMHPSRIYWVMVRPL